MDWFVISAWAANSAVALLIGCSSAIVYRLVGAKNRKEATWIVILVATAWGLAEFIVTYYLRDEAGTIGRRFINTAAIVYVSVLLVLRTRQVDLEELKSRSAGGSPVAEPQ